MAGATITVTLDDAEVKTALTRLGTRMSDLSPAMRSIGEKLLQSTRGRIEHGGPAPDGAPWAPLSPVTLARKKGVGKLIERGRLLGSFNYRADAYSVTVGTNVVYAAVHQFGMRRGYAGTGHYKTRRGSFPIPWGDIPARPFLGVSSADRASILDTLTDYLQRSATG